MKIKLFSIIIFLILPYVLFCENEDIIVAEVKIIDILKPTFYSGIRPTYYIIIVHIEDKVEIFYKICLIPYEYAEIFLKDHIIKLDDILSLDIDNGKTYSFKYSIRNIDGYGYNDYKLKLVGNYLLEWNELEE